MNYKSSDKSSRSAPITGEEFNLQTDGAINIGGTKHKVNLIYDVVPNETGYIFLGKIIFDDPKVFNNNNDELAIYIKGKSK